jgi:hypothetical protein
MPESSRRFRFGLAFLLLVPLWISPLFLSALFVREEFYRKSLSFVVFVNVLACTAVYAAFLTARSRRRIYQEGRPGRHHVLPAAWRGALFGLLFMVQLAIPWGVASYVAMAQRQNIALVDFLRMHPGLALETVGAMLGVFGMFGLFLGALGGSLVGIFFDWRYTHAPRATVLTPPRCPS